MGCYNSTVLNATPDQVWTKLRDFYDMSWAPNVVESCEAVASKGNTEAGAKRVINAAIHETMPVKSQRTLQKASG